MGPSGIKSKLESEVGTPDMETGEGVSSPGSSHLV
jgi:hypothetical protein